MEMKSSDFLAVFFFCSLQWVRTTGKFYRSTRSPGRKWAPTYASPTTASRHPSAAASSSTSIVIHSKHSSTHQHNTLSTHNRLLHSSQLPCLFSLIIHFITSFIKSNTLHWVGSKLKKKKITSFITFIVFFYVLIWLKHYHFITSFITFIYSLFFNVLIWLKHYHFITSFITFIYSLFFLCFNMINYWWFSTIIQYQLTIHFILIISICLLIILCKLFNTNSLCIL